MISKRGFRKPLKARRRASIAVFCSGNGSNLQALLDAERSGRLGGRIDLVVSDRPDAYAIVRACLRGKAVALIERKYFESRRQYDCALKDLLNKRKINLVVLAGFMRILSADFISGFRGRILNIHPSLLPAFPGAHSIRDAVKFGVKQSGVTVHFATEELDNGPIILQEALPVRSSDTEKDLAERIHRIEHRLYPRAVRLLAEGRLKLQGRKVIIKTKPKHSSSTKLRKDIP